MQNQLMQNQPQPMVQRQSLSSSSNFQQPVAYSFTKEQYEQILYMLNKGSGTPASANMTSTTDTSNALLVYIINKSPQV